MIKAVIFDCFGVVLSVYSERNDDMIDLVRSLRGPYRTGMLSNVSGRATLDALFHKNELVHLFDEVIASGDVGLEKPDQGIYELAAHQLGVRPEECLFIDDINEYCSAAQRVGMQAIHCTDTREAITAIKNKLEEQNHGR